MCRGDFVDMSGDSEGVASVGGHGARNSGGDRLANEEASAGFGTLWVVAHRRVEENAVGVLGRGKFGRATTIAEDAVEDVPAKVLGDSATCLGVSNATCGSIGSSRKLIVQLSRCIAAPLEGVLICCGVLALITSWEELSSAFIGTRILEVPANENNIQNVKRLNKNQEHSYVALLLVVTSFSTLRTRAESVHVDVNRSGVPGSDKCICE